MLTDIAIKEKMSGFRHYPLLFLTTFFLLIFCARAEAAEVQIEKSGDLKSTFQCSCESDDMDSDHSQKNKGKCHRRDCLNKPICCPGPKGEQGPRGPQGVPACPGTFTDFASYQLIFLPGQLPPPTIPFGAAIPFKRQVLIRGSSISSFPPFSTFMLAPGTYEISLGISNDGMLNQVQLIVGSKTYTFPASLSVADFITYRKIVQVFIPTTVKVTTINGITFTPPATTTGIGAYINFVRVH